MLDSNDPKLTAYVLGELDEAERTEVERQLADWPELRQAVEQIRDVTDRLSGSLQAEPCPELTDAQRTAIAEQSTAVLDKAALKTTVSPQGNARWWAIATALSLLIVVAGVVGYFGFVANNSDYYNDIAQQPSAARSKLGDYDDLKEFESEEELTEIELQEAKPDGWGGEIRDQRQGSRSSFNAGGEVSVGSLPSNSSSVLRDDFTSRAGPGGAEGPQPAKSSRVMTVDDSLAAPVVPTPKPADSSIRVVSEPSRTSPAPDDSDAVESPTSNGRGEGGQNGQDGANPRDPAGDAAPESASSPGSEGGGEASEGEPESRDGKSGGDKQGLFDALEESASGESKKGKEGRGKNDKSTVRRTWKRVKAIPNTSRLMIGDRDELPTEGVQVNVVIDGFRARVLLDCYYYNNRSQQLEGNFKLRLPNDASLYYFAFGETSFEYRPMVDELASNGFLPADVVRSSGTGPDEILGARSQSWSKVKEARMVPREKAAHAYSEIVRRRVDPALVEWSGAGVFNARIFPLMPNKLHRIVVGYDVNLRRDGDDLVYQLDLPQEVEQRMIDLNVAAMPGAAVEVSPQVRPFTSGGRAYYHFKDPHENTLEVRYENAGTMVLVGEDAKAGEFFAAQVTPDLPVGEAVAGSPQAIFLVDTSLSSNPDKFNVWLKMLEATLENNRGGIKQFAVMFFNIESHWWKNGFTDNTPENVRKLLADCNKLALEGATDLRQALAEAGSPSWAVDKKTKDKNLLGKPDLFLLSDGAVTWGELNLHLLARTLRKGSAGSLFAYKTGMTGTAIGVLEHLARESGGSVFSIVNEGEVEQASTAHRQRPWQLINVSAAGSSSDLLTAGRIRSIYPGQSLLLVGRGQPGDEIMLELQRGEETRSLAVRVDRAVSSNLAARLYGQVSVGQLEDLRTAAENVASAYARHFRVTGQTCSLLMLESEADYQRFDIKPEDDVTVVKVSPAAGLIDRKMEQLGQTLEDPKAATVAWLKKMETLPGFKFKMPTLLELALEQMPTESFDVAVPKLVCEQRARKDLPRQFFEQLSESRLNYDVVTAESARRMEQHGASDALRALSSLIENNPGDPVLTRDVAFSAIEWGLGGQAYPLLKRVANARPYQPQIYQAIAQCLGDLGHADLAIVYYEVALHGQWHQRYKDFHKIASVEYLDLLQRVASGEIESTVHEYAKTRLASLVEKTKLGNPDLIVTMMWNTDRTDVDLHVREPSGEECFYKNPNTRSGGRITGDVTEGFGPEMYVLSKGANGKYVVRANYYGSDNNRAGVRSKVYVKIFEYFGTPRQQVTRKTVTLSQGKEMRDLATVNLKQ